MFHNRQAAVLSHSRIYIGSLAWLLSNQHPSSCLSGVCPFGLAWCASSAVVALLLVCILDFVLLHMLWSMLHITVEQHYNHFCVNVCGSQTTAGNPVPKPCVPELRGLLHFNQASNELFHCNGVSWKPWAPTDQVLQLHNTNTYMN